MSEYRVLARKYRPQNFEDLVGQDALVRTLTNAISRDRLAHAFLLTGIRGIGKTTTARIIARALNCLGDDGSRNAPSASPCGVCANCVAIAGDRHVDVIEMDAASRTGVEDIRDIIETIHYAPTSARYKVYIIDEVHMLSKNAFNALLKTLEEPPPHVKFIFATTELRKIPVTILSRCQRFNLRRVEPDALAGHLQQVCDKEEVKADGEALRLIASAAEGSVRDALSVLDQAIVHTDADISATAVRDMLGMTDKSRNFDLLEHLLRGDVKKTIGDYRELCSAGADPLLLLQDLLQIVHVVTLLKLSPELENDDISYSEAERSRGRKIAENVSVASLSLVWQMLLKAVDETRIAPHPLLAAEMAFVRISHAAQMPPPAEIVRSLKQQQNTDATDTATAVVPTMPGSGGGSDSSGSGGAAFTEGSGGGSGMTATAYALPQPLLSPQSNEQPVAQLQMQIENFAEAAKLFQDNREMILYNYLTQEARLVSFRRGHIELNLPSHLPADTAGRIGKALSQWTGERWIISLSQAEGEPTLAQQRAARFERCKLEALQDPLVAMAMETFPGAEITDITKQEGD